MIGARLRISDVETCNTSVFVDLLYVGTSCIAKYTTAWRCYLFLYSVKDPPVISRKILQKWLLWAKPESSAILSIV